MHKIKIISLDWIALLRRLLIIIQSDVNLGYPTIDTVYKKIAVYKFGLYCYLLNKKVRN